jgi:hypothetical protein
MILCDREIRAALARDAIRITPDPTLDPTVVAKGHTGQLCRTVQAKASFPVCVRQTRSW